MTDGRPVLVYDDDCGFCTRSALFVGRHADVELVGFSALSDEHRARLPEDWRECAHLLADDAVYSCGEAMERAFELTGLPPSRILPVCRRIPGHDLALETGYRFVADNRDLFGRLTRRLF